MPYPGKNKEEIVSAVMHRYKQGKLHSGSDKNKAESHKQAIAIALAEAKKYGKR